MSFDTGVFPDDWKEATVIPLYKGGERTAVSNYRPISLLPLPGKLIEKVVHSKITTQLVYLFNMSFDTGVFPDDWKEATVIPLYKGGERTAVSNYRPISLLPLPGKLIEKVVHSKIVYFLEANGILTDKQNGFRKGFSTSSAVADLTDDFFSAINDSELSLAVFVDLRKAFDTVCHDILCKKLKKYGIRGKVLEWCRNYLTNRRQCTLANGTRSNCEKLSCGVPQGSVLGPLFFIVYVNDLEPAFRNVNTQLYADDTVLYASGADMASLVKCMQTALYRLQTWCNSNKLTLNPSKTKMMIFGTRPALKKVGNISLVMGGRKIQKVPTFKYLGFTLDSSLSFSSHITDVIKKVIHKRLLLSKIRPFLTEGVALSIYKMMILPYFDYCDIVYQGACVRELDKLQRLQNKCLKTCLNLHRLVDTDLVHSRAKCSQLTPRRETHLCTFRYGRQVKDHLMDQREISTRLHDANVFKVPFPNKETFKRSVLYAGAKMWNDLPTETRQIRDLFTFKTLQKRKLLT